MVFGDDGVVDAAGPVWIAFVMVPGLELWDVEMVVVLMGKGGSGIEVCVVHACRAGLDIVLMLWGVGGWVHVGTFEDGAAVSS